MQGEAAIAKARRSVERDLVRLVYSSTAAANLSADDLDRIGEQALRNNGSRGLTGLLVHQGRGFYGVLEGPRRQVFMRMEAIATDPRHSGVCILREEEIATCRFLNWNFTRLPTCADAAAASPAAEFLHRLSRGL